jgi:hypothetical protein
MMALANVMVLDGRIKLEVGNKSCKVVFKTIMNPHVSWYHHPDLCYVLRDKISIIHKVFIIDFILCATYELMDLRPVSSFIFQSRHRFCHVRFTSKGGFEIYRQVVNDTTISLMENVADSGELSF